MGAHEAAIRATAHAAKEANQHRANDMATEAQRRKDEMEQSASDYATKTQNIADAAENKYNNAQQAADDAMATAQRLAAEAARAKTQFQHRDNEAKVAAHSRDKLINLNIFHFWPEARQGGVLESSATKAGEASHTR